MFLILFSFLINLFFASLCVFLDALVLSTYSILTKINFPLRPRCASSLVIPTSNKVIGAALLIHQYFVFVDVIFFEHSSIFSTPPPPSLEVLSLPLIFPILDLPSESYLLQLDCYRFILIAHVQASGLRLTHLLWRLPL